MITIETHRGPVPERSGGRRWVTRAPRVVGANGRHDRRHARTDTDRRRPTAGPPDATDAWSIG